MTLIVFVSLCISFTTPNRVVMDGNTKGMELIESRTLMMGVDSTRLKAYTSMFNVSSSIFDQEYPAFRVMVLPYYLDKHEVTNAQYKSFVEANLKWSKQSIPDSLHDGNYLKEWTGNEYPKGQANYPVVYVNWHSACAYAKWQGKRLPTEAEWEYAANGNSTTQLFSWGNKSPDPKKVNFSKSGIDHPIEVDRYHSNGYGIYNMSDNVSELVLDQWRQNIHTEMNNRIKRKDRSPIERNKVVIRGGNFSSPPVDLRVTYRLKYSINECSAQVGFRCAMSNPKLQWHEVRFDKKNKLN